MELVAGIVEPGEDPEQAMRRELLEEMGYEALALTHISTFYVSPGGSSERVILYCADVDSRGRVAEGGGLRSKAKTSG